MRFPSFKEFDSRAPITFDKIVNYLKVEHALNLKELITGLARISFLDNFVCFRATVTIPAGTEVSIENKLRGAIPTDRIITRSNVAEICDGDTAWSMEFVTLKNTGATSATVTAIFFK